VKRRWLEELASISHRDYCTGFYFNDPEQAAANEFNTRPLSGHRFLGKVIETRASEPGKPGALILDVRNKITRHDPIEVLGKRGPLTKDVILSISDLEGNAVGFAQPGSRVAVRVNHEYAVNDLIRQAGDES
jgi:putative protease